MARAVPEVGLSVDDKVVNNPSEPFVVAAVLYMCEERGLRVVNVNN